MKPYYGITYPHCFSFRPMLWLWKKLCCKRNWHLWDETCSIDNHYLVCDACDLMVDIAKIDEKYVDESLRKLENDNG